MGVFSLGPSTLLSRDLGLNKSDILFSTALDPLRCCRRVLNKFSDLVCSLPSPFSSGRLGILVSSGARIACHGERRGLPAVISGLGIVIRTRYNGCLIFYPSCTCLRGLRRTFHATFPGIGAVVRRGSVSRRREQTFLRDFTRGPGRPLVKFTILNNVFSRKVSLGKAELSNYTVVDIKLPVLGSRASRLEGCFSRGGFSNFRCTCRLPNLGGIFRTTKHIVENRHSINIILLVSRHFTRHECIRFCPRF